jgi:hypothetical protein
VTSITLMSPPEFLALSPLCGAIGGMRPLSWWKDRVKFP